MCILFLVFRLSLRRRFHQVFYIENVFRCSLSFSKFPRNPEKHNKEGEHGV